MKITNKVKITWKHTLLSLLLYILTFITSPQLPQPYRLYVGLASIFFLLFTLVLYIIYDLQTYRGVKRNDQK